MKIEVKTKEHTDYYEDIVTFEDDGDFVEINHRGSFSIRKSELKKVLYVLCED